MCRACKLAKAFNGFAVFVDTAYITVTKCYVWYLSSEGRDYAHLKLGDSSLQSAPACNLLQYTFGLRSTTASVQQQLVAAQLPLTAPPSSSLRQPSVRISERLGC